MWGNKNEEQNETSLNKDNKRSTLADSHFVFWVPICFFLYFFSCLIGIVCFASAAQDFFYSSFFFHASIYHPNGFDWNLTIFNMNSNVDSSDFVDHSFIYV